MKKFLSILLAAVIMVCVAVPAFAADATTEYPNSFTATQAEAGVHVLDGIVGADEYDVKIEGFHKDNEDYIYYHCVHFQPAHGKDEVDSAVTNWYFGYDEENLYWAVEILDGKRAINEKTGLEVTPTNRAGVAFFVGDPADDYAYGVHVWNKSDGSVELAQSNDAAKGMPNGATEYDPELVKYGEKVNEDETVTEVWEVKIPFDRIIEYTGAPYLGSADNTVLYFWMFVEVDNAYEELCDRINIAANKNSDNPVTNNSDYFIINVDNDPLFGGPAPLFELKLGHICAFAPVEVEGGHQSVCSCGEKQADVLAHEWDPGIISKEATASEEGELLYTCFECGAEKTEAIAKLDAPADEPADDTTGDHPDDVPVDDTTDDEKKGCGASLTAMGLALVATLGLGVTVLSKKN